MFHLTFGILGLGMFAVLVAIFLIPMWLGPLIQALIAIFSKGKIARWIPSVLGLVGLAATLYDCCIVESVFPVWGVLLYWAVYGLLIWAAHAIVCRIKEWLGNRQRR